MPEEVTPRVDDAPAAGALVGAFSLAWTSPPGWDIPPAGFRPDAAWERDPYWPPAPGDWLFWQVTGISEVTAQFTAGIEYVEPVETWVPAPGWPIPRPGFAPADDWEPDPRWPAAPADWKFWRVSDQARDEAKLANVATRAGRLRELNRSERMLDKVRSFRAEVDEVEKTIPRLETKPFALLRRKPSEPSPRDLLEQFAVATAHHRDALLASLVADHSVDDRYLQLEQCYQSTGSAYLDVWLAAQDRGTRAPAQTPAPESYAVPGSYAPSGVTAWQQAEQVAAGALRQMGHPDADVTAAGADGGVDVRGGGVVAQVKYELRPVGRPVLQQLVGAAAGSRAVCFARSGYTRGAQEYALQAGIALFRVELPTQVTAVNTIAAHMASHRG